MRAWFDDIFKRLPIDPLNGGIVTSRLRPLTHATPLNSLPLSVGTGALTEWHFGRPAGTERGDIVRIAAIIHQGISELIDASPQPPLDAAHLRSA